MEKIFDEQTLAQSNIFELRNIARELGVYSPTIYKKEELIEKMMQIVNGEVLPHVPKSKQGRPPKSSSTSKFLDEVLPDQEVIDKQLYTINCGDKTLVLGEHTKAFLQDTTKTKAVINQAGYFVSVSEEYGLLRDPKHMNDINACVYVSTQQIDNLKLKTGDYVNAVCKKVADDKPSIMVEATSINNIAIKQRVINDFDLMDVEYSVDALHGSIENEFNKVLPLSQGKCIVALNNKQNKVDTTAMFRELNKIADSLVVLSVENLKEQELFLNKLDKAESFCTLLENSAAQHCSMTMLALQRAKRLAENGKDVVFVVDSLDKVIKNYNLFEGKNLLDLSEVSFNATKQLLGAARKFVKGGSLTVLAIYNYKTTNTFDQNLIDELEGISSRIITIS